MSRILNAAAVKRYSLDCAQAIGRGKFTRVSDSFINEIRMEVESLIRSVEAKYPAKTHGDVPSTCREFATGELFDKLRPILDRAIARLIQRRVEQHPSCGSTLMGK